MMFEITSRLNLLTLILEKLHSQSNERCLYDVIDSIEGILFSGCIQLMEAQRELGRLPLVL